MKVMAQRTGEKKVVAAKNIAIFAGKLRLFCIKTKVSFWPFFIMSSLHSFPAKMSTFIASKNIIFLFYGTKSLGENDKIFKNSHKNCFYFFLAKNE